MRRSFSVGGATGRPHALAGIRPKADVEAGKEEPWELKNLRKTCATYYDTHVPESSGEIVGHAAGGITYRRYARRAPLAFRAIMSLPSRRLSPPSSMSVTASAPIAVGDSLKLSRSR